MRATGSATRSRQSGREATSRAAGGRGLPRTASGAGRARCRARGGGRPVGRRRADPARALSPPASETPATPSSLASPGWAPGNLRGRHRARPLDADDDPLAVARARRMARDSRRRRSPRHGASVTSSRTGSRFPERTRGGRSRSSRIISASGRPAPSTSSRSRSPATSRARCPLSRRRAARAAGDGSYRGVRGGLAGRARHRERDHRLEARAGRCEGVRRRRPAGARDDSRHRPLCDRPGGGRARSRADPGRRPAARRVPDRDPDRAPDTRLRLRDARVPDSLRVRPHRDPDDSRRGLGLRQHDGALHLRDAARLAHRARNRRRLLVAHGLPLPRGAGGRQG